MISCWRYEWSALCHFSFGRFLLWGKLTNLRVPAKLDIEPLSHTHCAAISVTIKNDELSNIFWYSFFPPFFAYSGDPAKNSSVNANGRGERRWNTSMTWWNNEDKLHQSNKMAVFKTASETRPEYSLSTLLRLWFVKKCFTGNQITIKRMRNVYTQKKFSLAR